MQDYYFKKLEALTGHFIGQVLWYITLCNFMLNYLNYLEPGVCPLWKSIKMHLFDFHIGGNDTLGFLHVNCL